MGFRDDREAAFQRAESLEQELAKKQRELDELRAGRRRPWLRALPWALGALACLLALGGGLMAFARSRELARERAALAERAAHAQDLAREEQARLAMQRAGELAEAQLRAAREREQSLAEAQAALVAASLPTADVVWQGTLDDATGTDLAPGAPCTLEGTFAGPMAADLRALKLVCGGRELYRAIPGAAGQWGRLREGPVEGGGHAYMLSYTDNPADIARPVVDISTLQHRVSVTRARDALHVAVYLRDVSEAREGPALLRGMPTREPAFAPVPERAMRVRAARGRAPAAAGARCTVDVRPVWEFGENCRMAVRCGGAWVYGARESGYLTCELRDGRPVGALDTRTTPEGGDPRVTWRDGRIEVSDYSESGEWSLTLAP